MLKFWTRVLYWKSEFAYTILKNCRRIGLSRFCKMLLNDNRTGRGAARSSSRSWKPWVRWTAMRVASSCGRFRTPLTVTYALKGSLFLFYHHTPIVGIQRIRNPNTNSVENAFTVKPMRFSMRLASKHFSNCLTFADHFKRGCASSSSSPGMSPLSLAIARGIVGSKLASDPSWSGDFFVLQYPT